MADRPRTIICDIDGVLFRHQGDICVQHIGEPAVLSGVREAFRKWDLEGCRIILLTGRRESTRKETEAQLSKSGLFYDQLIMGVTGGVRVLINDRKPNGAEDTSVAINVTRNEGLAGVQV